jgi:hypothetical protein
MYLINLRYAPTLPYLTSRKKIRNLIPLHPLTLTSNSKYKININKTNTGHMQLLLMAQHTPGSSFFHTFCFSPPNLAFFLPLHTLLYTGDIVC